MSQSLPQADIQDGIDRRRHERIKVPASGRLMVPSGQEFECRVEDISEGGIALDCEASVNLIDRIVVYLDDLGRFEGTVVRVFGSGFAIETNLPAKQRQRLYERIAWLKDGKTDADRRAHPRRVPTERQFTESPELIFNDGQHIPCKVLDISVTGAHVKTDSRPPVGTHVTLGRMQGTIVRYTTDGVGIEFIGPADERH